jgi:hypothetical protein
MCAAFDPLALSPPEVGKAGVAGSVCWTDEEVFDFVALFASQVN